MNRLRNDRKAAGREPHRELRQREKGAGTHRDQGDALLAVGHVVHGGAPSRCAYGCRCLPVKRHRCMADPRVGKTRIAPLALSLPRPDLYIAGFPAGFRGSGATRMR
eukprot:gene36118-59164_t